MKRKKKTRNNIKYSKIIILLSLFLFVLMIFRVLQLSTSTTIDGINLQKLASKRTTKTDVIKAKRGTIYSKDNEALAINVSSYKIIAYLSEKRTEDKKNPQHVVDKEKTAKELAPLLEMSEEDILKYLNKEGVYQTEFGSKGKGLSELTKQKIEELNLPGIDFIESYKRYYPKGQFLSYTLGYAKQENEESDTISGEMGIELYYDKILKGKDGYVTYQKDLRGYKIADSNEVREDAVEGKDIYLTVDSNIQFFIEQALNNAAANYTFDWFTMVIADAKTGAILGMSTSPSFDPNIRNIENYIDNTVALAYEPGSTMKTFTYMAAMENGVYDGNETYKSGVYTTDDGTEIGDWNRNGWGTISYDKGYALSSNVGVINIINRHMNAAMLRQYFKKLGFGSKTGISLPNEVSGKLNFKYETEIYNAGFGQGITTTPLQNIQALTPLTNDGMLIKPYLVEKIVNPDTKEVVYKGKKEEIERVASTNTVNKMLQLMDDTVNGIGNTGSNYRIDSGELIGKTGTAQIADEKSGGYLSGKQEVISSFAGVYPKSNPKIIIYASIKRPPMGLQKPISDAVKDVVNNIGKYLGTEVQSASDNVSLYKLPSFINKTTDTVKTTLTNNGMNYKIIGNGTKVIKQYPAKNEKVTNKDTIYLITNDSSYTVPNVVGLSSKEANDLLKLLGLKVNLEGSGYVISQSVLENTPITDGMEITLTLNKKFEG